MEQLILRSRESINQVSTHFQRYLIGQIAWDWRLIGIKGARGIGNTTLLLQHIQQEHSAVGKKSSLRRTRLRAACTLK